MNDNAIVVAVMAALGVLGVVVMVSIATIPQAEARGCESGFHDSAIGVMQARVVASVINASAPPLRYQLCYYHPC